MSYQNLQNDAKEILNDLPGGFFLYEAYGDEKLIYANNEMLNIFGCESLEEFRSITGNSFRGLVHPEDLEHVEEEIAMQIRSSSRKLDFVEYRITRRDGQVRWLEDFGHLSHSSKWGDVFYVFVSDITDRKRQEISTVEQMKKRVLQYDVLTGLYSKNYFFECAAAAVAAEPMQRFYMLASDIENFRYINEKYGIERGNEILKTMAARGKTDLAGYVFGGRVDGDRFAYLFRSELFSEKELQEHAQSLCREFHIPNMPIKYGLYEIEKDDQIHTACNRALLALDSIKGIYGKQLATYSDNLRMDWIRRQQITASAEVSLQDRQFLVYYQPKHDLGSDRTGGAEALVRWIHPDYGFMNPGLFIPLFEKNGFITKLDMFVLEEVCRSLVQWQLEGRRAVPISINLSRHDLDQPGMAEKVIGIVDSYGLDHSLIHFEITESCFTENQLQTYECIQTLHRSGFEIELDDFGAGYSSLTTLSRLPIDVMKIDLSIVRHDNPGSERSVLEYTIQLAKMMRMKTVQEGVETEAQLNRVRQLGCDYVQGFYFAKPLPMKDFEAYLEKEL